ncbi:Importin subunit alpha-1b [Pelomyxa schiedti]|nr:Importin subunit alpha-1b [Pelomyxa schiedti]
MDCVPAPATRGEGGTVHANDFSTVGEMCRGVMSPDFATAMSALLELRKLMSNGTPPIDEVLASPGCVSRIIQFLSASDNTDLQYEALWVLTNLCSGTDPNQTLKVVELGALPHLTSLLSSPSSLVCEQAIWALGNIAGTGPELRNAILELGFIPAVVNAMHTFQNKPSLLKYAIWAFSNGCRGEPPPPVKYFLPTPTFNIFSTLAALLQCSDMGIIEDTILSLRSLSGITEFSKHIISLGMCPNIVRSLGINNISVQVPAIRILGTIALGSHEDTQAVIDAGVLPKLLPLLHSPARSVKKETCWLLSNIAAGIREQVRLIAAEPGLFERVIELMSASEALDIRMEAAWIVCNAARGGSVDVPRALFNKGALRALVGLFDALDCGDKDTQLLGIALHAIRRATRLDNEEGSTDQFTQTLIDYGIADKLTRIQYNTKDIKLCTRAINLLPLFTVIEYFTDSDNDDNKKQEEPTSITQLQDSMDTE